MFDSALQTHKCGQLWTEEHERYVIRVLKSDKNVIKNRQFYHIKSTFKLVNLSGVTKVARIKDNRLMATKNNVFSIIHNLHTACAHKGEKKTYKKVCEFYANIPMSLIKRFIEQCAKCSGKNKKKLTWVDTGPITVRDLDRRCRIEIIDFQSLPDGENKFILHYKDNITKFNLLRSLVSKSATEVAKELLNIFLDFGSPNVLETDDREFTADVIRELGLLWSGSILINGRSSAPRNREREKNDGVTEKLVAWMRENNTSSWSGGLRFVQWDMNTTRHDAVNMEPYVAVFGRGSRSALSSRLPDETRLKIVNGLFEEEIEQMIYDDCCEVDDNGVSDVLLRSYRDTEDGAAQYDVNNNKDYPVIHTIEVIGVDVLTPVHGHSDNIGIQYTESILHDDILLIKGNIHDT